MMRCVLMAVAIHLLMPYATPARAESVTVAVAANMQFAFADLGAAFTQATGIEVKSVIGSSGKLAAQIQNGAPFDVFVSADTDYPETLYRAHLTADAPTVYAYGVLVMWTFADLDLTQGLSVLANPRVTKIVLANPALAPYGRETKRAIESAQLLDVAQPKFVFGENIAQVNQYVSTRVVDVGFTAKSVVLAPALRDKGKWIELPKDSYTPIAQSVVILSHGRKNNSDASSRFMTFFLSPAARAILANYGYALP